MNYEQDKKPDQEGLIQAFTIKDFPYQSAKEAKVLYASLSEKTQEAMAVIYKEAFAGPPWNERFRCPSCGIYVSGSSCPQCAQKDLPEAYPTDQLKKEYFPLMISEFTPGGIIFGYNSLKDLVGFSTGGFSSLAALVRDKYENNPTVLTSLTQTCNTRPDSPVFYDNETCIRPLQQKGGLGRQFSQKRIDLAISMGAQNICGRTINLPWLKVKEGQLTNAGYSFIAFIPEGDTYNVLGQPRRFYWASRK